MNRCLVEPRAHRPTVRVHRTRLVLVLLAACCVLGANRAAAQEAVADGGRASTPRRAVDGFLGAARAGDLPQAATYLDFQGVPPSRIRQAPDLAGQLLTVLDRALWIDLDRLNDTTDGDTEDGLPRNRELVGTIQTDDGPVEILLTRTTQPDGTPRWKLAGPTVAKIPQLYAEFGHGPYADYLPAYLLERGLFGIELWQWIGLVALVPVAWLVAWAVSRVALAVARSLLRRWRTRFDHELLTLGLTPVRLVIAVLVFAAGARLLALGLRVQHVLGALETAFVIFAVTWVLLRAVDVIAEATARRLMRREQFAAASVMPLGRRTTKIVVAIVAVVAMLQNLGFNVTGVLAALGVGGLAIALAAQKTVENLFGGLTLIADQPVRVGDLCRFGDRTGTVEDIGLRSTRVRTQERTVISIANADFAAMQLENFRYRDRMWWQTKVGLPYDTTADQVRAILGGVDALLRGHADVDPASVTARLAGFGSYALEIELSAYVRTTDSSRYLVAREELLLGIMDIVAAHGTRLAIPVHAIEARDGAGPARGAAESPDGERERAASDHANGGGDARRSDAPA